MSGQSCSTFLTGPGVGALVDRDDEVAGLREGSGTVLASVGFSFRWAFFRHEGCELPTTCAEIEGRRKKVSQLFIGLDMPGSSVRSLRTLLATEIVC